jgi:hypothetical protein
MESEGFLSTWVAAVVMMPQRRTWAWHKSFLLYPAWSTEPSARQRTPASAIGHTLEAAHFVIRAAQHIWSLLFDNHVSSDDRGLAAAKTKFLATVPFYRVRDRDSGDALLQL